LLELPPPVKRRRGRAKRTEPQPAEETKPAEPEPVETKPIEEPEIPEKKQQNDVEPPAPCAPSPVRVPKTPGGSSPMKPPMSEMHPSKVHPTMGPPSSALRLGFTDIKPAANRGDGLPAVAQTTPSKVTVPSSAFTFRMTRNTPTAAAKPTTASVDISLSDEALKMMGDIREQAAKLKEDLRAQQEAEKTEEELTADRKIARAKGKAGRFSAAHMAEFKKMDSIENHPSVLRYHPDRLAHIGPLKPGVKRTQDKANLDESESTRPKQATPGLRSAKKEAPAATAEPPNSVKRPRQHKDEDVTSKRPSSRDGSSIPAPKSVSGIPRSKPTLSSSLLTPTKASLARTSTVTSKTPAQSSLIKSPSKPTVSLSKPALSGIPRSATTSNLHSPSRIFPPSAKPAPAKAAESNEKKTTLVPEAKATQATETKATTEVKPAPEAKPTTTTEDVKSPSKSRFEKMGLDKMKALLRDAKMKSALPVPASLTSKTPAPDRPEKSALPVPSTTPGRKLAKQVSFTPETQRAAMTQNSPSPIKSSNIPQLPKPRELLGEVYYPSLDALLAEQEAAGPRPLPEPPAKESPSKPTSSTAEPVISEFTFRSEKTISFGSSPGQATIRPVRPSILPTEKLPVVEAVVSTSTSPNKENVAPSTIQKQRSVFLALPHGMSNKKRHRPTSDEEDAEKEAAERAAKKQKMELVPEGDALLAPRLTASVMKKGPAGTVTTGGSPSKVVPAGSPKKVELPGHTPATPSPIKKKTSISLSRLSALARPKIRK